MTQIVLPCFYGVVLMLFLVSCDRATLESFIKRMSSPGEEPTNFTEIRANIPIIPIQKGELKIIAVSTGNGLNQFAQDIKKTLNKTFEQNPESAENFCVLHQGGRIDFPTTAKKIRFGEMVDALDGLQQINEHYSGKIQSILYLTDNANIPDDLDNELDPETLIVPFSWKKSNINLTVLTTKSCVPWNIVEATCISLEDVNKVVTQLENELNIFLK